ncbi:NF-kappa-B-activating protein, partial [Tremellales sp. Uapishka_1]
GYSNGPVNFEQRRAEREQSTYSIWPPSPKAAHRDEDEREADRKASKSRKSKKSSRSKKSRKYDSESDTDSEDERRRRRRREKERERERERDDDDERERRKRRRVSRSEEKKDRKPEKEDEEDDGAWVVKGGEAIVVPVAKDVDLDLEDDEVGPNLPTGLLGKDGKIDKSAFAHMRPGEGEAMAAYAASGQRIPRRGEIGMEAEDIEQFEASGYVMSGSRHQRMNAVRMRKENQVINAEEKRAILNLQKEEKMKKEGMIISQFKEMMDVNLRKQGIKAPEAET